MKNKKPYAWVPSLYLAEALPYVAVMVIATTMYKRLGLSNTDLALYTSWLYLPWVIKPLWSPFIASIRTERWWVLVMQLLIGAGFAGIAFTLPMAFWLQGSLAFFWILAFASATHDIAADGLYILGLSTHDQSLYVGIRSTFYRIGNIVGQGLLVMLAGWLEKSQTVAMAWSITFFVLAGTFIALWLWHSVALPDPHKALPDSPPALPVREGAITNDSEKSSSQIHSAPSLTGRAGGESGSWSSFWLALKTFFTKPHIVSALLFMLFFRFPEGQLVKIANPFLLDSAEAGGLALSTEAVGFVYGTIGIIGLTVGGLLGGWCVSRHGLKRWLWPMVLSISLPDLVYVYLADAGEASFFVVNLCVFIEQFGYGFGFTAYMLYLVYFSQGERSTAVFSICTAMQALGMMLPGMIAGWMADQLGYLTFFWWVVGCCLVTFGVSALIKIDPDYGKK
ncbi:MAG: MFS transporter [Bacteroidaceae bacterium]|nr:MFS transporter [Bacteroidaceae bacterium]